MKFRIKGVRISEGQLISTYAKEVFLFILLQNWYEVILVTSSIIQVYSTCDFSLTEVSNPFIHHKQVSKLVIQEATRLHTYIVKTQLCCKFTQPSNNSIPCTPKMANNTLVWNNSLEQNRDPTYLINETQSNGTISVLRNWVSTSFVHSLICFP